MPHVRRWKRWLAVEGERHMVLHALYLRRTAVFVIAAVLIGTTVEVARPFVLVGSAVLLEPLVNAKYRGEERGGNKHSGTGRRGLA